MTHKNYVSFLVNVCVFRDEDVHCYGQHVNHLLFNPGAGEAYRASTSGHALKDGKIMLAAGFAHGV